MDTSPFLVLIHGHGVDASIWDGIYTDLVAGASALKPDFAHYTDLNTIEAYADELNNQLKAERTTPVILVGHSMGGYVALAFAEKYPEQIAGLVLYHSTALADDDARREVRRQAIDRLKQQGTSAFIQKQLPKMVAPNYPSAETQQLIERYKNLPANALIAGLEAMAARPDRTDVLRNATYPVLLVAGAQDQIIPPDKMAQLADLSDKINLTIIEQAGHLSMVEQPRKAVEVLRDFLREL